MLFVMILLVPLTPCVWHVIGAQNESGESFFGFLSWVGIEFRFWPLFQLLVQCFCCSLCIKHPNLFGGSEKLDVSWDKGLYDSNILVAYRRPRPQWVAQQCFFIQVCNSCCSVFLMTFVD